MLIICTATTPKGTVTYHLVRAEAGSEAYRRLKPLLTRGASIETRNLEYWMENNGTIPEGIRPLDKLTTDEKRMLKRGRAKDRNQG